MTIEERKRDHLDICLHEDVNARQKSTLFECVELVHKALPELNIDDINTETVFLGHRLKIPLLIDSMTGGTQMSLEINKALAEAAEEAGIGIGVGSQRAGLRRPEVAETYAVVRRQAPNAFVFGNIGAAQLVKGLTVQDVKKAIEMIDADAVAVHLNPLQEAVQVGGDPQYRGALEKIRELAASIDIPIIAKEVGAGISGEVALQLEKAGVKAINVSGAGGTSWSGVESIRALRAKNEKVALLGSAFWDWGIPTAAALINVRSSVSIPVIASGGIRNGIEIAKAIALGADVCAMARPFLMEAARGGKQQVLSLIEKLSSEIRLSMFLTGSPDVGRLREAKRVLRGELLDWVRGLSS
ncbi:MAG: type 2 isopentenyl-diphosphate Delta-isomerase [Conexivisphaerales archaeon]